MLRNGLYFVATEAVRASGVALAHRYRESFVLGSLREDVIALPFAGFSEYPSFSHFGGSGLPGGYLPFLWPGPRAAATRLFRAAERRARRGELAPAFVALGRLSHVIADVSIPSHVHRAAHDRDPFEWWVEGNLPLLQGLTATLPSAPASPSALVRQMAEKARVHRPDRTNTPLGRALRRAGVREPVRASLAKTQALDLIPEAVAHSAALLRFACSSFEAGVITSQTMSDDDDAVLLETLDALDLPRRMLPRWFSHNRAFCESHGGRRVYPGLLALLDRCDAALAKSDAEKG